VRANGIVGLMSCESILALLCFALLYRSRWYGAFFRERDNSVSEELLVCSTLLLTRAS
jgi:hypothetical protein